MENVWSVGNSTNNFRIDSSNDVTLINPTAEDGATPTSGPPILITGALNTKLYAVHCEIINNNECIQITGSSSDTSIYGVTTYFLTTLTSPGVVTIKNSSANTTVEDSNAIAQAGTVTLSYLIQDFVGGQNVPGAMGVGFTGLTRNGYYSTKSTYPNTINAFGLSTLNNANVSGVLGIVDLAQGASASPPTPGGCTTATISASSTNQSGIITAGAVGSAQACVVSLTWAASVAYSHGALCYGRDLTNPNDFKTVTVTTTATTLSGTATTGDQIWYQCSVGH